MSGVVDTIRRSLNGIWPSSQGGQVAPTAPVVGVWVSAAGLITIAFRRIVQAVGVSPRPPIHASRVVLNRTPVPKNEAVVPQSQSSETNEPSVIAESHPVVAVQTTAPAPEKRISPVLLLGSAVGSVASFMKTQGQFPFFTAYQSLLEESPFRSKDAGLLRCYSIQEGHPQLYWNLEEFIDLSSEAHPAKFCLCRGLNGMLTLQSLGDYLSGSVSKKVFLVPSVCGEVILAEIVSDPHMKPFEAFLQMKRTEALKTNVSTREILERIPTSESAMIWSSDDGAYSAYKMVDGIHLFLRGEKVGLIDISRIDDGGKPPVFVRQIENPSPDLLAIVRSLGLIA